VIRSAAIALAAILLAGCSTVGETVDKLNPFSSSAPKVKPAELTAFESTATLRVLWQASIGSAGEFVFTPAITDDAIYAAAKDGAIARFTKDGKQVWRIAAGQPLSGGIGADDKHVAVGTLKGEVLVFEAETGRETWKARASSEVLGAPVVADGQVIVRSGDSRVFGFDAIDGKRRWVYQRSVPSLTLRTNAGLLYAQRAIFAGFPGGKLVAINPANGAAHWEATVALPKGASELERVADVTSLPIIDGKEICAVAFQGRVACFDLASGSSIWAREMSSRAGIDLDERAIYVSDDKGNVSALDRRSGGSLWKQDKLFMRAPTRPLALGSRVAVADYQGVVHLLRREDGAFAARLNTDGSPVLAEPQRVPGGFLIQTRNGGLYAIGIE
jgi:outer membrane protein assembly factor BamB